MSDNARARNSNPSAVASNHQPIRKPKHHGRPARNAPMHDASPGAARLESWRVTGTNAHSPDRMRHASARRLSGARGRSDRGGTGEGGRGRGLLSGSPRRTRCRRCRRSSCTRSCRPPASRRPDRETSTPKQTNPRTRGGGERAKSQDESAAREHLQWRADRTGRQGSGESPAIARLGGGGGTLRRLGALFRFQPPGSSIFAARRCRRGSGRDGAVISGDSRGRQRKSEEGVYVWNRLIIAVWVVVSLRVRWRGPSYPSPRAGATSRAILSSRFGGNRLRPRTAPPLIVPLVLL